MPRHRRLRFLDGAAAARGATVVIDVFRAFTTAAFALDAGADRVVVASATAASLRAEPEVTLVVSGWNGVEGAEEDEACADLISLVLGGDRPNLA